MRDLILSREEARQAKDDVKTLHEMGLLDLLSTVEAQWDITCRTVPL